MAKQTRVEKYKKLRNDIDKMDDKTQEEKQIENSEKRKTIVKESIRHAIKEEKSDIKVATLTMSIDELLEGHQEYIGAKEKEEQELKQKKKKRIQFIGFGILAIVLIVVITIVIINMTK